MSGRYNEPVDVPSYRFRAPKPDDMVTCYKALQCLHYQCSESATLDDPLYQELDRVTVELAALIISDLPQYKAAPWDWQEAA